MFADTSLINIPVAMEEEDADQIDGITEVDGKLTANPGLYIDVLFEPGNIVLHTIRLQCGSLRYDSYK